MKKFFTFLGILLLGGILSVFTIVSKHTVPSEQKEWIQTLEKLNYYFYAFKGDDPAFRKRVQYGEKVRVDVVIPVVEKDLNSVVHVIDAVRGLLMHPLGKIYLVAPESKKIRQVAQDKGAVFVLEDTVMPPFSKKMEGGGWIKQQYLKLNADSFVGNDYYLVIDADTIFIRPQVFLWKGKTIFNYLKDCHLPRKQMVQKALGIEEFYFLDFTAHHMFFEKRKLKHLKSILEERHGKKWYDALNELDIDLRSFSEYELYANFVVAYYPDEILLLAGRNISLPRDRISGLEAHRACYSQEAKSLSYHHFYLVDKMD